LFVFITAFIIVLINHSTRGTRQGNIKHAPRSRPIDSIRVLNLKQKTTLQTVIGISSSPSLDGDMGKLFHSVCDLFYDLFCVLEKQSH
jgi:hypothetical protein